MKPSLRAAFAFSLAHAAGHARQVHVSPREIARQFVSIAESGRDRADAFVQELHQRREQYRREREERERQRNREQEIQRVAASSELVAQRSVAPEDRAATALEAAGARLLRARRHSRNSLEVCFEFMDERFISLVDPRSLHVYDAGICLDGADEELTLESLPVVIREAIDTGQLCITRR